MLNEIRIRELLAPFELSLSNAQVHQVITYAGLLQRWNSRINLTAIRNQEESVVRHFGESLYLARSVSLQGSLLDIGSGAGFPGLALKIAFPELRVTLLEPVAKKRAFLKEAARACAMDRVEVRAERLDAFAKSLTPDGGHPSYDSATARAVGDLAHLVPQALKCLKPQGRLFLWLTRRQAATELPAGGQGFSWETPIPLPLTRDGVICVGSLRPKSGEPSLSTDTSAE